jgi:hypothetical protein
MARQLSGKKHLPPVLCIMNGYVGRTAHVDKFTGRKHHSASNHLPMTPPSGMPAPF